MNKDFDELWERFLADKLNGEEIKELQRLLANKDQQIGAAIDGMLMDKEITGLAPVDREKVLLQKILAAAPGRRPARVRVLSRLKWAAAILLFLAAGSGWYWHLSRSRSADAPFQPVVAQSDIPPGHNGAILTLSDGKKIVLDSAGNGEVASDAHVKVLKKGGELSYEGRTGDMAYNNISTPKGRQWQLRLSDGTRVWLNAQSSIRYPVSFAASERIVEITGEAYFEVAQDDKSPFIVKTPGQEVQVLGTHFNVNVYDDEPIFTTTVLEGSVKVTAQNKSLVIRPGQQAANNHISGGLKTRDADVNDVIAWINGRFKFDHSDIRTVMRQLARWYDVEVEYQGSLPDFEFAGGTFRNNNLSEVLHVLELSGVHFKVENRKIIVMQ